MAHDFAEKEMRPVAWEYDKDGTARGRTREGLGARPHELPHPRGVRRTGPHYLEGAIIEEEIAWGCSGIATSLGANGLATAPLGLGGSEELKKEYLGMLTEEYTLASFCLTEPDAGSDVSGMRTTAVRRATSTSSTAPSASSPTAYADFDTVYAKTDKEAGQAGRLFWARVTRPSRWTRRKTRWASGVQHRDDHLQRDRDPGRPPDRRGEQGLQDRDDEPSPHPPRRGGHGRRNRPRRLRVAAELLEERVQFGVPIAMHQAIQFMIADMATKVTSRASPRGSRPSCSTRAAATRSSPRTPSASPPTPRWRSRRTRCRSTAGTAHRGTGEKLMRDAKIMQLYEGRRRSSAS